MELTYRYTPLSTARSTRVIEIRPALMKSATVVIKIHETRIDHPEIPYEAVSYTWDGQTPDQPINCDQKCLHVTKNAHDILRRLRRPRRTRLIWIDAICIDQACEKDKHRQVAMMADIYRTAKQVVVWLGNVAPGLPSLHQAIQKRRNSSSFFDALWERVLLKTVDGYTPALLPNSGIPLCLTSLDDLEYRASHDLDSTLQHPYWRRAWTAQEFALNQNCSLHFSDGQISKKDFRALFHISKDVVQPFHLVHLANWLTETERWPSDRPSISIDVGFDELCSVFECLPHLRSYLPVDRVFALVSVYPHLLGNVTIDYRCKPAKVYTEATMCIIQSTGHLSILSFAGNDRGGEVTELPSWVPDWSMTRAPLSVCGLWLRHPSLSRRRRLAASMPLSFDSRGVKLRATRRPIQHGNSGPKDDNSDCPKPNFDINRAMSEGILRVKGVFVAEVSDVVSDMMEESKGSAREEEDFLNSLAVFLSACFKKFGSTSPKDQLITCMEFFEKYFEDYARWIQASDEARQEDRPEGASMSAQGSETEALRTWVGAFVDEVVMDDLFIMNSTDSESMDYNMMERHHRVVCHALSRGTLQCRIPDEQLEFLKDTEYKYRFISKGQRLFMTVDGILGIAERVEPGDMVVLIAGCDKPFIIRQNMDTQSFQRYRLVGEAYLNGVQDGQKWPTNDRETTNIFLV